MPLTGKTCKTCSLKRASGNNRTYYKCRLVKQTHGPGTDIRLKSPACSYYTEAEIKDTVDFIADYMKRNK